MESSVACSGGFVHHTVKIACALAVAAQMFAFSIGHADNSPPIDLRADKLELNIYGGRQILSGNVVVVQGGLTISADKLQVDTIKGAISRISGNGAPVVVSNNTPGSKSFRVSANSIDYQTSEWSVVVEGNVTMEVPGVQLRSARVEYDIRKARLILTAGPQARVNATLTLPADSN